MKRTDKNIIKINSLCSIEDILVTIGSKLRELQRDFQLDSFADVGFYFRSVKNCERLTFVENERSLSPLMWSYEKTIKVAEKGREEAKNTGIDYERVFQRLAAIEKAETEAKAQADARFKELERKHAEETRIKTEEKALIERAKQSFLRDSNVTEMKNLRSWIVKSRATALSYVTEEELNKHGLPILIFSVDNQKHVYYKDCTAKHQ